MLSHTMQIPGDLMKSGVLYEGNYDDWYERVVATLRLLGADFRPPFCHLNNGTSIEAFIRYQVHPRLLWVIPETEDNACGPGHQPHSFDDLLEHLKIAAKPFAFMALPIDVRAKIYTIAISAHGPIHYDIEACTPFGDDRIHCITRASRQLRDETLAIAWSDVQVRFGAFLCAHQPLTQHMCINSASRFRQLDAFEQSNKVSRRFPITAIISVVREQDLTYYTWLLIQFSRSESKNLEVTRKLSGSSCQLTRASDERVQQHLDYATSLFNSSDPSSAATVVALFGRPELWASGELRWEWDTRKKRVTTSVWKT